VQSKSNIFGTIALPPGISKGVEQGGLVGLLTAVLRLMVVVAGIYALFNFVIAGYQFMNAGGDSKAVASAWARIWQSMIGIVIVASAFLFAALIGKIFFGSAEAILNPRLYKP
jgi:thiamine transporter ThiT